VQLCASEPFVAAGSAGQKAVTRIYGERSGPAATVRSRSRQKQQRVC
jgi:hypothetical protein